MHQAERKAGAWKSPAMRPATDFAGEASPTGDTGRAERTIKNVPMGGTSAFRCSVPKARMRPRPGKALATVADTAQKGGGGEQACDIPGPLESPAPELLPFPLLPGH
jgi:hypothetical protein